MSAIFAILTVLLVFLIVFQIAKASEYVSVLKGEKKSREQSNRINAALMIVFLICGLIGVYVCNDLLKGKLLPESASVQGEDIDWMMNLTLIITGIVFFITQILLFVFAYRYRATSKRKAYYYPHNTNIEILWTAVPAIVMTVLVAIGLKHWFNFTGDAPKNAMQVEITGKQFMWMVRYPGADGQLGKKNYKLIDINNNNILGLDWSDPATHDDIVETNELHLVVNKPVKLLIGSQDVVHDVGMPYFRLKMDAVPGIPTSMWLTPRFTTKEMIKKTNNPDFTYWIVCDQLCGNGHYGMKAKVIVETQSEYDKWMAGEKPVYKGGAGTHALPGGNYTSPGDSSSQADIKNGPVALNNK